MIGRLLVLVLIASAFACTPNTQSGPRLNSQVITEEELRSISVATVYEAIQRLRPIWLRAGASRSVNLTTEIAVVENGAYFGPLESLRTMPAMAVRELRFLDGASAIAEVPGILGGGRHIESAILVFTGLR